MNDIEKNLRQPVLCVQDLRTAFRVSGVWKTVVDRISFEIGEKETLAVVGESGSGKSVTAILRKPYAPIFSITPANNIEPAVGAWTWASGSQVCTGTLGIFVAKPMSKSIQTKCLSPSLGIKLSWMDI